MFEYSDYRDFLNDELIRRTSVNRAYSLRAFAKSLDLSSGELSELLRGVRKLSLKSAIKISKALGLTSSETKHLLSLVEVEHGKKISVDISSSNKNVNETKLSIDQFDIISEWYHFAILNLAECKDFEWSYSYISKKLGIKPYEVKVAIDKMVNVGLITKFVHKNGNISYKVSEDYVMSNEGIPSKAIRNYHRQILNKAIESLELQPVNEREISGIGMAIDMNDLKAIKKDISEFQDMLIEKYSKGKKERVYQLEVALFALSEENQ
jgi:uncharacterized protein (TIGR02147 family)